MTLDRADSGAIVFAVAAHAGLVVLLAMFMARGPGASRVPEPPTIEVSFADEVSLVSAGETSEAASSPTEELGPPEQAAPAEEMPAPEPVDTPEPQPSPPQPQPQPQPRPQPQPQPKAQPQPRTATPAPRPRPTPTPPARQNNPRTNTPTPSRTQPPTPRRPSGNGGGQRNRGPLVDPNTLGTDPPSPNRRPPGETYSPAARASVRDIIRRALLPCERQSLTTPPEANVIRVRVDVTLNRDGSIASATPRIVATNARVAQYEDEMMRAARRIVTQCSLRGLAARYPQFYDVQRGWRSFPYVFNPEATR